MRDSRSDHGREEREARRRFQRRVGRDRTGRQRPDRPERCRLPLGQEGRQDFLRGRAGRREDRSRPRRSISQLAEPVGGEQKTARQSRTPRKGDAAESPNEQEKTPAEGKDVSEELVGLLTPSRMPRRWRNPSGSREIRPSFDLRSQVPAATLQKRFGKPERETVKGIHVVKRQGEGGPVGRSGPGARSRWSSSRPRPISSQPDPAPSPSSQSRSNRRSSPSRRSRSAGTARRETAVSPCVVAESDDGQYNSRFYHLPTWSIPGRPTKDAPIFRRGWFML